MKLSQLNLVARAARGATLIVRNIERDVVDDPTHPDHGKNPAYRDANGTPLVTLTLQGADSRIARKYGYIQRANGQNRYASERAADPTGASSLMTTPEQLEADDERYFLMLAEMTMAWTGIEEDDGAPAVLTIDKAYALYANNNPVYQQALRFVDDRADFFAHSLGSSAPSASISLS